MLRPSRLRLPAGITVNEHLLGFTGKNLSQGEGRTLILTLLRANLEKNRAVLTHTWNCLALMDLRKQTGSPWTNSQHRFIYTAPERWAINCPVLLEMTLFGPFKSCAISYLISVTVLFQFCIYNLQTLSDKLVKWNNFPVGSSFLWNASLWKLLDNPDLFISSVTNMSAGQNLKKTFLPCFFSFFLCNVLWSRTPTDARASGERMCITDFGI